MPGAWSCRKLQQAARFTAGLHAAWHIPRCSMHAATMSTCISFTSTSTSIRNTWRHTTQEEVSTPASVPPPIASPDCRTQAASRSKSQHPTRYNQYKRIHCCDWSLAQPSPCMSPTGRPLVLGGITRGTSPNTGAGKAVHMYSCARVQLCMCTCGTPLSYAYDNPLPPTHHSLLLQ